MVSFSFFFLLAFFTEGYHCNSVRGLVIFPFYKGNNGFSAIHPNVFFSFQKHFSVVCQTSFQQKETTENYFQFSKIENTY